ncbi:MAG: asparaginase [Actinobacteria bacterium]|nr:asparaginase [Actinomycetota bacterium]
MALADSFAPVAISSRSGFDESVHFGAVVGLGPSGEIEFAIGDPQVTIYPRSSNKPMQTVAMLRCGLRLPPELLALACASHDGTPMHTAAVLQILAGCGLDVKSLANTPGLPLDEESQRVVVCAGAGPTPLLMNCSGKHSAMLATCVHNGWSHDDSYLAVDHPLQEAITATIDDLCAAGHVHIGVDGCGAPAHAMSLIGLARAFRSIADGSAGDAGTQVYSAMTTHPEMVGGRTRDVTLFMQQVPAMMAKDGADGVFAAAFPDGRAVALKIADGGDRARPTVMVAALRSIGVDVSRVAAMVEQRIMGHGQPVGVVRAVTA